MKKVVVFGTRDFAQLALYYFRVDSPYEVAAFTESRDYLGGKTSFEGLPLVAFEDVETIYPPEQYDFFAPMAASRMNKNRERIYLAAKQKGYKLVSYVHSSSIVYDHTIIGENCFILENNVLQPYTKVGNNVILWCANILGHHAEVGDHVFMTYAVITGHVKLAPYCFLGVNSSVRECVKLAEGTYVAMNSAIYEDTEPWSVYRGDAAVKQDKTSMEMWG